MNRKTEILLFRWCSSHHFIVFFVSTLLLGMICGYAISVGYQKLPNLFPYISDTGSKPPASCIFGMLLNLASVFAFIIIIIRHSYVENSIDNYRVHTLNDIAYFFGFLTALGAMIVSNFQESNALLVHMIGAFMCFACGITYSWIQLYISLLYVGIFGSKLKLWFRFAFSCLATITFISTILGAFLASIKFSKKTSNHTMIEFDSSDPGYPAHLVSTFSEWIMVISFACYFLTFYHEFKKIYSSFNISHRSGHEISEPQC
ncbi:DNA damage-regulated autophagy modulator protein 1 [Hydra vulgaris]|uniref:DNA damage-regulated autophagy modulator protein 1 n=1 Tax=Hydra vulgaris TaxID=6087 RepID=A0ABM4BIJ2_HYDVU